MLVRRVPIFVLICVVASITKAAPKADGDKSSSEEESEVRYELCSEIKCGLDAVKTPNESKPEECTCVCPDEVKGDPFFQCEVVKCGRVPGKFRGNGRFVFSENDDVIASNHWPWMASLGTWDEANTTIWNHKCGASIITKNHLLTAAHCATMIDKEKWSVLVGISDFDHIDEHDDYERHISEIFIHELFEAKNKNASYYDVAVLELDEPIVYSDDEKHLVGPICLPTLPHSKVDELAGTTAVLTGWGAVNNQESQPSHVLRTAVVTVYSQSHCDELHENGEQLYGSMIRSVIPDKFQDNIICAGNPETRESACHGDSGGPLVQFQGSKVNSNHYVQIGVVQGGILCGDPYFPTIFANLGDASVLEFALQKSGLMKGTFEKAEEIKEKCSVQGECLNSPLLGHSTQDDEIKCRTNCKETSGCTWYTFDKENQLCLTHTDCSLLSKGTCQSCISGHASC